MCPDLEEYKNYRESVSERSLLFVKKILFGGSRMTPGEAKSREAVISFLIEQTGLSRQEAIISVEELEAFGLIGFGSNGDFRLKEV